MILSYQYDQNLTCEKKNKLESCTGSLSWAAEMTANIILQLGAWITNERTTLGLQMGSYKDLSPM